jgi:hypothetical protein
MHQADIAKELCLALSIDPLKTFSTGMRLYAAMYLHRYLIEALHAHQSLIQMISSTISAGRQGRWRRFLDLERGSAATTIWTRIHLAHSAYVSLCYDFESAEAVAFKLQVNSAFDLLH